MDRSALLAVSRHPGLGRLTAGLVARVALLVLVALAGAWAAPSGAVVSSAVHEFGQAWRQTTGEPDRPVTLPDWVPASGAPAQRAATVQAAAVPSGAA